MNYLSVWAVSFLVIVASSVASPDHNAKRSANPTYPSALRDLSSSYFPTYGVRNTIPSYANTLNYFRDPYKGDYIPWYDYTRPTYTTDGTYGTKLYDPTNTYGTNTYFPISHYPQNPYLTYPYHQVQQPYYFQQQQPAYTQTQPYYTSTSTYPGSILPTYAPDYNTVDIGGRLIPGYQG